MTEAEQILKDLFSIRDLGDFIYEIRNDERLGWEGLNVIKYGDACERATKLLKGLEDESQNNLNSD